MHFPMDCFKRKKLSNYALIIVVFLLAACGNAAPGGGATTSATATSTPGAAASPTGSADSVCPAQLRSMVSCSTPTSMRIAYGMQSLIARGMTGKGQTVVDIVSFGSPTLQQDIDAFDKQFGLPPVTLQIMAPIGSIKFDPNNNDMLGWAEETSLDVEIIHAMAPDAGIVVLTSPVDETEGTIGLPEFLKLEQYAVDHKLGQIFSQSYVASETTLADQKGRQLVTDYTNFYKQIAQQGWTVVSGSGDHGATDYSDLAATKFSSTPIVNFPADVPWVTAVGGTTLLHTASGTHETAWSGSGGGFSKFFSTPDFQKGLPASVATALKGQRGIPDVAANANPSTAMAIYFRGEWLQVGGTSAATPTWAAIIAVANQMAGHPLGFINPGLYKIATSDKAAQDFRDIIGGDNSFAESGVSVQGYTAITGWDAVTGCGAPIADKLLPDLITALNS
ncbi:MAG TPA: S53 family peptidase [Ktedonobacteraceae bacterium]|nr:S53 family peptidase [Ktedonobacteraceae bacterium]